ncbi:MAG: hypothetical protein AAF333_09320 [Planctomycetota bacterium]
MNIRRAAVVLGCLVAVALAGCHTPRVVLQQPTATAFNDVGSNGQVLVPDRDMAVRRAELQLTAESWAADKAKAVGSDVLLMILDDTHATLAVGYVPRADVPTEQGEWAGADLDRRVRLEAGRTYVLRVIEVSRGGAFGWNNYGFAKGNRYPPGGLTSRFTLEDDLDYAFRLLD